MTFLAEFLAETPQILSGVHIWGSMRGIQSEIFKSTYWRGSNGRHVSRGSIWGPLKRGPAGVKLRPRPGMRGRVLGTNWASFMCFRSPYCFLGVSDPKWSRYACGQTPVYAVSTRLEDALEGWRGLFVVFDMWKAYFLLPPVAVEVAKNMRSLTDLSRLF